MNIFMQQIYAKKRFGLIQYFKYRKFVKSLRKVMPNFGMLWQIADFIKLLEQVYFYDNGITSTEKLFSSLKYKDGENGFIVRSEGSNIIFKLFEEDQLIVVELERKFGNKLKSSMRFYEERDSRLNKNDEMLLSNIIDTTMDAVISVLKEYYKIRKV